MHTHKTNSNKASHDPNRKRNSTTHRFFRATAETEEEEKKKTATTVTAATQTYQSSHGNIYQTNCLHFHLYVAILIIWHIAFDLCLHNNRIHLFTECTRCSELSSWIFSLHPTHTDAHTQSKSTKIQIQLST